MQIQSCSYSRPPNICYMALKEIPLDMTSDLTGPRTIYKLKPSLVIDNSNLLTV